MLANSIKTPTNLVAKVSKIVDLRKLPSTLVLVVSLVNLRHDYTYIVTSQISLDISYQM